MVLCAEIVQALYILVLVDGALRTVGEGLK
jgi:hypothetical protein